MLRQALVVIVVLCGTVTVQAVDAYGQLSYAPKLQGRNPSAASSLANNISGYVTSRPSVSPYLSLLNVSNAVAGLPSYHTAVRPRLEQQRQQQEQMQQQNKLRRLQAQVSSVRRDMQQAQQGNGLFPTGHPTRFGNYLHYFPGLQ